METYKGQLLITGCEADTIAIYQACEACQGSVFGLEVVIDGTAQTLLFDKSLFSLSGSPGNIFITYTATGEIVDGQQTITPDEWQTIVALNGVNIQLNATQCLTGDDDAVTVHFDAVKLVCFDEVAGYSCDGTQQFQGLPAVQPDGHVYRVKIDCQDPVFEPLQPVCQQATIDGIAYTLMCTVFVEVGNELNQYTVYQDEVTGDVVEVPDGTAFTPCGAREYVCECYRVLADIEIQSKLFSAVDEIKITFIYDVTAGAVGSGNEILISAIVDNQTTGQNIETIAGPAPITYTTFDPNTQGIACEDWVDPNTPTLITCTDAEGQQHTAQAAYMPCYTEMCGDVQRCDYASGGTLSRTEIFSNGSTFDGATIDGVIVPTTITWDSGADPTGAAFIAAIEAFLSANTDAASVAVTISNAAPALALDYALTDTSNVVTNVLASPIAYPEALSQSNCVGGELLALRVTVCGDEGGDGITEDQLCPPPTTETTSFGTNTSIPAGFKAIHINNLSGVTTVTNALSQTYELGDGRRDNSIDIEASSHENCFNGRLDAFTISGGTWQWFGVQ